MIKRLLLLVGQQGTGKTSLGYALREVGVCEFISAGVLLREEARRAGEIGSLVREANKQAAGVPTTVSYGLLGESLGNLGNTDLLVLDGYPRKADEADLLIDTVGRSPDLMMLLEAPTVVSTGRLLTRKSCVICGRPFGAHPEVLCEGWCPSCGGELEVRDDDTGAGIQKRHRHWRIHGPAIVHRFADIGHRIDASRDPGEVLEEALLRLEPLLR